MTPDTFRHWLRERGCSFDQHEHHAGEGVPAVTVRRGDRRAELPMASSRKDLDPAVVGEIVEALGLDPNELPGPQSRV
jgi:hypothetical protein